MNSFRRRRSNRRRRCLRLVVLGVDGEPAGSVTRVFSALDHLRRTADGVLVEVEAQLVRRARRSAESTAPLRHEPPRASLAAGLRTCSRTSTDRACASSPSARASVVIAGANAASAVRLSSCTEITLTKSVTESPPRIRAAPLVGST